MKKLLSSLFISGISLLSAADNCCPPNPCPPTCPVIQKCCPKVSNCCNVSYELYGEVLFLQPNGSNLYYAVEAFPFNTAIAIPEVSPNWTTFEISPDYHPAFEIGAKLFFPKSDMNLVANWERIHSQDTEFASIAISGNMMGPAFDIGPNSAFYTSAKGRALYHFDAANLVVGKTVCFVSGLNANFYAGASFTRIKQSMSSLFKGPGGLTSRLIYSPSLFTGAGPQFGVDLDYKLFGGFSFTGSSNASLYVGQQKNSTTFKSTTPALAFAGIPQPNVQTTTVPSRTQLIPGFEEKMGFAYTAGFKSWRFSLAAGYQFQIYINAVQSFDMTAPQVLPSLVPGITVDMGVYAVGFERTLSNFILSGPYVTLNLDF
jgi:hypothetical protein